MAIKVYDCNLWKNKIVHWKKDEISRRATVGNLMLSFSVLVCEFLSYFQRWTKFNLPANNHDLFFFSFLVGWLLMQLNFSILASSLLFKCTFCREMFRFFLFGWGSTGQNCTCKISYFLWGFPSILLRTSIWFGFSLVVLSFNLCTVQLLQIPLK